MRRYFARRQTVMAVMTLGFTAWTSTAQEATAPLGLDALTLTLEIPHRRFLPLEPVPMRLILENRTDRPVVAHTILGFDCCSGRARLFVEPDGSRAYVVDDLSPLSGPMSVRGRTIQPGQRYEVTEEVAVKLDKIFPNPGGYRIQVILGAQDRRSEVRSNTVALEIENPTGFDAGALAYINGSMAAGSFFSGAYDDRLLLQLEEFAAQFGDSSYGGYADLILGVAHLVRRDYEKARAFFSRAATKPNFPLAARAAQRLKTVPHR